MRQFSVVIVLCCLFGVAYSIKCYICNSGMQPACESDYEKFGQFCPIKSFQGKPPIKPTGCRIVWQNVQGQQATIRECAYFGEPVSGKSQKGSMGVSRVINQCDKDLCNPANTYTSVVAVVLSLLAVYFAL